MISEDIGIPFSRHLRSFRHFAPLVVVVPAAVPAAVAVAVAVAIAVAAADAAVLVIGYKVSACPCVPAKF